MKKKNYQRVLTVAGLFALAATAPAQSSQPASPSQPLSSDDKIYQDSTNRFTLSLRFGLNISAKLKGIGGSLNPASNNKPGQYDDGYVLTDISGNAGGQTWNWGYDNSSQVNAVNHTVSFDRTTAVADANNSSSGKADSDGNIGFEIEYDRQLGVKEDWHNIRYGIEAAFNYTPIDINQTSTFGATATRQTDTFGYTPGTTPPSAPYQGSFGGPGFVLNVPRTGSSSATIPNATVTTQDNFDANLWGLRLGPYVEFPFGKKQQFTLALSAGLAVGLIDANESWKQTVNIPGNPTLTTHGGGENFSALWGGYAALDADYQFSEHWGVSAGVQFEDLGKYDHSFDGRQVNLDLSKSIYFLVGVSYNF
jgi:hypothetical protein